MATATTTTTLAATTTIAASYVECRSGNIIIILVRNDYSILGFVALWNVFLLGIYIYMRDTISVKVSMLQIYYVHKSCWISVFQVSNSKIRNAYASITKENEFFFFLYTWRMESFHFVSLFIQFLSCLNSKRDWKRHSQHLIIYLRLPDVFAYVLGRKIVDIFMHLHHFQWLNY